MTRVGLNTSDIIAVIFLSVVFRAAGEIYVDHAFDIDSYYVGLLFHGLMYVVMGLMLWFLVWRSHLDHKAVLGASVDSATYIQSIGLAFLLVAFSLGENAVEVLIVSRISLEHAYSFWNFHTEELRVHPLFSLRVMLYLLVNVVLAALIEEFVFRGLLLRTLGAKMGLHRAIVIGSIVFTFLHFASPYYISTFVFSLVLYYVYILKRSLIPCVIIHGTFNLAAFIHQYYLDIHWARSINQIASLADWQPQLIMFGSCSVILIYLAVKHRNAVVSSSLVGDMACPARTAKRARKSAC